MNPDNAFGPTEPALPGISAQPGAGAGAAGAGTSAVPGMPPGVPNIAMAPPIQPMSGVPASDVAQTPGGPAPAVPQAPSAADAWLPPTVPVGASQAGSGGNGASAGQPASSSLSVPVPDTADDGDIIEKEWVDHAKAIVAQYRQDPYKQARELHRFKAEYLMKRYNKKIEAVED